jgi:3-oxoacyl-[acyl-carrier-protein] synthase II
LEITLKNIELLINGVSGAVQSLILMLQNLKLNLHANLKTLMLKILDRKEARKMDRYAQYAMVSSEEGQ